MSSAFFPNNATLQSVERPGGFDRFGKPLFNTVSVDARGRLEKRTIRARGVDGVTTTIDGTLQISGVKIEEGDKITMADGSEWEIFNVDESLDLHGKVLFTVYGLTKQRKKS